LFGQTAGGGGDDGYACGQRLQQRARAVLESDEFADAVRGREAFYRQQGIHSVPAIILNGQHLIQGGQPVEAFEQALRQVAGV